MGHPEPVRRFSEAEYLAIERAAETKSEFFDGAMYAMSGGTLPHSRIATNLASAFNTRLRGHPCQPFNSDLRVKVEATGLFTYPDLSVVCGPAQLLDTQRDTLLNPTVLVEVLSDSTEAYDRGKKFEHYRQVPSLCEYLLVSQHEPRVELFVRQPDGRWLLHEAAGTAAELESPTLKISIPLAEIFEGVEFVPSTIRAPIPQRPSVG